MKKDTSIIVQSDRDLVRERPGMYIGDREELGMATIVREIIDNAIDEYPNYPNKAKPIEVTLYPDNSVKVRDYGRGISPYESAANPGKIAERLAYTIIGAGGKFDKNRKSNGNQYSSGLHGTGASATNFMSTFFDVTIWKDNRIFHDRFENGGIPVIEVVKGQLPSKPQKGEAETGTEIHFKADPSVMNVTEVDVGTLDKYLTQMSYLTKGLVINFHNQRDGEEKRYYSENGLIDYITDIKDDVTEFLLNPFQVEGEYKIEVAGVEVPMMATIALAFSKDDTYAHEAFTNRTHNNQGGTHLNGFSSGLVKLLRHYYLEFKSELDKKYKRQIDTILKITGEKDITNLIKANDIKRKTYVIIDFKHPAPVLAPQTKDKLMSTEAKPAVETIFYDNALRYLDRHIVVVQELLGYLIKRLYERAKNEDSNTKLDKATQAKVLSSKLSEARSNNPKNKELFIVEGDSAGGQIRVNRNPETQAVLPLRGKVLNTQNSTVSKMLSNEELSTFFAAIGTGIGSNFDITKLRYDKIIIMTDQDTDGLHIRALLLTAIANYTPELLIEGHVYVVDTPLFINFMKAPKVVYQQGYHKVLDYMGRRKQPKGYTKEIIPKSQKMIEYYAYSDDEQQAIVTEYRAHITDVQRNKGLGELTPEQVIDTILTPETRRMTQYQIYDFDEFYEMLDELMGSDPSGRRRLVMNEGA